MTHCLRFALLASVFAAVSPRAGAQVSVAVNASSAVRVVDSRMFGLNTADWDGAFSDSQTLTALTGAGAHFIRYPGGSYADLYKWQTNQVYDSNASDSTFKQLVSGGSATYDIVEAAAQKLGAQMIITVDYVMSTPADAANWVADAKAKGYGIKYWEVGNECYGTWEYISGLTSATPDPVTYATQAVQFINQMKAADPTIKVGVVADASEDSYVYGGHSVTNPVTGASHSGWTPVMLATMKSLGTLPDFLIYHYYPQNPGAENDAALLQVASNSADTWAIFAKTLRAMLTDYVGTAGSGIELLVTENNSVSYNPGKQTTSLVNALYFADSLGSLMQTEFNSFMWWDLHNGQDSGNNNSSNLYGWRAYGDYGIESGSGVVKNATGAYNPTHDPYPVYFAMKLMGLFAQGGDTIVAATSSNTLLGAYAAKHRDGTLSVLLINKDPSNAATVNLTLSGYAPEASATLASYGKTQDNNAEAGSGSTDIATSTVTGGSASMSVSVPSYSLALYTFTSPNEPPVAKAEPTSQTVATGSTAVFTFTASGAPAPTYQWSFNGSPIAGATDATLVISNAGASNAGSYTCTATNATGSATSTPAALAVIASSTPGRLINLSCRAGAGTGQNVLTAGYVIGGAGTSGTLPVLVRASGPALAPFGLTGLLNDPELILTNVTGTPNVQVGTNTGWGGSTTIFNAASAVGAFSWGSKATADSALFEPSLSEGNYTAEVQGASGDTGLALVEVYDATPSGTYTTTAPRLTNLSTRVQVPSGTTPVYDGFVISGSTARTVLIRATGPTLNEFGLTGLLADPQLILTNITATPNTVITTNTGWGGDPSIKAVAASVGAFSWGDTATNDSAIVITLAPGNYTAGVVGAGGDGGLVLIEVYEVP